MRVLLDECLPRRLVKALEEFDVHTVPDAGWAGKKNGELLRLAASSFEVFVTMDRNLQYQQNLQVTSIGVIVLKCRSNRYDDLLPLIPKLVDALGRDADPGQVVTIEV